MSPRMGRPTNDPKILGYRLRMSDKEAKKLDFCCEILGLTKSEVLRQGIDKMYIEAQTKKKE